MKIEIKDRQGHIIQTADLPDGEYTLSVSGANLEAGPIQRASARTIFLGAAALLITIFNQYLVTSYINAEFADTIRSSLEALTGLIISILFLSLISRALTHKFNIWECASFVFTGFLGYAVWGMNLFGLRWALPRFFWIKEIYVLLLVVWMCFMGSYLVKILAGHLSARWRKSLVGAFALIIVIYNSLSFVPFRREYRFYRIDTPPPRPASLESAPLEVDQFLNKIRD